MPIELEPQLRIYQSSEDGWLGRLERERPDLKKVLQFSWSRVYANSERALLYWEDAGVTCMMMTPHALYSLLDYMCERSGELSPEGFSDSISEVPSLTRVLHRDTPRIGVTTHGQILFSWDSTISGVEITRKGLKDLA